MKNKVALITGYSGQDGHYLTKYLQTKKYRIVHYHGDVVNTSLLKYHLKNVMPDEIYNLAGVTYTGDFLKDPVGSSEVNGMGLVKLLNTVKEVCPQAKVFQAGTSEMYGACTNSSLKTEDTPFTPRSPYGISKAFAHQMAVDFRERHGLFVSCGILFNHESPIRPKSFVTRKITNTVANIALGLQDTIELGNLDPKRDWGFAGDYVEGMWASLQQEQPDDFIFATGNATSIESFLDMAFRAAGIKSWEQYLVQNPDFMRPPEKVTIVGDASKAKRILGWTPKTDINSLVSMMVEYDLELARSEPAYKNGSL